MCVCSRDERPLSQFNRFKAHYSGEWLIDLFNIYAVNVDEFMCASADV